MDRLINILGARARTAEAEVAAHGVATYRTTVAIVDGGTVAALLCAFLLAQFFITLPLQRMAAIEPRKDSHPGRRRCCEGGRQHGRTRQRERLDSPAWSKNLACAEASWAGTGRSHV